MAEPAPDCVDVDASAQKMGRGGVADGVRAERRFAANAGDWARAFRALRSTTVWMPNRVIGRPQRLRKTGREGALSRCGPAASQQPPTRGLPVPVQRASAHAQARVKQSALATN